MAIMAQGPDDREDHGGSPPVPRALLARIGETLRQPPDLPTLLFLLLVYAVIWGPPPAQVEHLILWVSGVMLLLGLLKRLRLV